MAKMFGSELTPAVTPRGKTVLNAFEYQDVRLLPGMLLTQVERRRADSILHCPTMTFSRAFVAKPDVRRRGWE
jgi:hypothetical protein